MLYILQIIVAVLLIVTILLQATGGGLSPVFGGGGELYRSKQNIEKFLIGGTIFLSFILAILSIALLFPHK
jgi:protein translocase SecG subunit